MKKVIWRNLAKVRLALKKYDRALVASNNFLKDEDQPYRRADGMLDKASILLGLGKYSDARKTAEEALALGVEGPPDGLPENCSGGHFLCGEKV